jgi:hypothetical protein
MQSRGDDIRALAKNEQCFCAAKTLSRQCHSWVKVRPSGSSATSPFVPQCQTLDCAGCTAASDQTGTFPGLLGDADFRS